MTRKQSRRMQRALEKVLFGPEPRAIRSRPSKVVPTSNVYQGVCVPGKCVFCGNRASPARDPWKCGSCGAVYPPVPVDECEHGFTPWFDAMKDGSMRFGTDCPHRCGTPSKPYVSPVRRYIYAIGDCPVCQNTSDVEWQCSGCGTTYEESK